jgi:hypothetical protein
VGMKIEGEVKRVRGGAGLLREARLYLCGGGGRSFGMCWWVLV